MATDPICDMTVDPNNAAGKHEHNGRSYYFCSGHCLAKFQEDPESLLASREAGRKRSAGGVRRSVPALYGFNARFYPALRPRPADERGVILGLLTGKYSRPRLRDREHEASI